MPPIRRSNRVPKPKIYWEPTIKTPHQQHLPAFTIHTDLLGTQPSPALGTQLSPALGTQSPEDLSTQLLEELGM